MWQQLTAKFRQQKITMRSVSIVIAVGILLRLCGIGVWGFGFDQVQIITAAQEIAGGDLTLIGPRTGPASLFTGPLIYYSTAIFYLLGFSYFSLIATTILIAAVTGFVLYYLGQRYWSREVGLVFLFVWAFSVMLIRNDQVTWNPNLTVLASSLLFLPLVASYTKKLTKLDYVLIAVGSFLGYQAHFSGFLFIPLSLLFFGQKQKLQASAAWLVSIIGFATSLLPTLLFDYKNNWLNTRGLWEFATGVTSGGDGGHPYLYDLWKSIYTSFESLGSIVLSNFELPIQILFIGGLVVFGLYGYVLRKTKSVSLPTLLPVVWILLSAIIFSLYSGDKPPYYFLLQVPAYILIIQKLYEYFSQQYKLQLLPIVFAIFAVSFCLQQVTQLGSFSLLNSLRIYSYITQQTGDTPVAGITYHVPAGEYFGLEYLLRHLPTDQSANTKWYLSFPNSVAFAQAEFAGVSVWQQPVTAADLHIYFDNQFRIFTQQDLYAYFDPYYTGQADQQYLLVRDSQTMAILHRYSLYRFKEVFKVLPTGSNYWQELADNQKFWFYPPTQSVFVLTTNDETIYEAVEIK